MSLLIQLCFSQWTFQRNLLIPLCSCINWLQQASHCHWRYCMLLLTSPATSLMDGGCWESSFSLTVRTPLQKTGIRVGCSQTACIYYNNKTFSAHTFLPFLLFVISGVFLQLLPHQPAASKLTVMEWLIFWQNLDDFLSSAGVGRVSPVSPCPSLPSTWWMIVWSKASDPFQPDSSATVNRGAFSHRSRRHILTWRASIFLWPRDFFKMLPQSLKWKPSAFFFKMNVMSGIFRCWVVQSMSSSRQLFIYNLQIINGKKSQNIDNNFVFMLLWKWSVRHLIAINKK